MTQAGKGIQVERAPKMKIRRATDAIQKQFNGLVYGDATTGKSSIAAQLAGMGMNVFVLFTDLGGEAGIHGAVGYAKKFKIKEAFDKHVTWANCPDLESFQKFTENPEQIMPGFWALDPDFFLFDGFSFFQQCQIMPDIEEAEDERSKDLTVEYGFDSFRGWGKVKNSTIRHLQEFLLLNNPFTGKPVHKILTAGLKVGSRKTGDSSVLIDVPEPDISGASKKMIKYAFDLVWQSKRSKEGVFTYDFTGDFGKRRIETTDVMPADFSKVWALQQDLWAA